MLQKNLNLVAESDIETIVTNDRINESVEPVIELNEDLKAPIEKDQVIGTATYTVDNISYKINLTAGNNVKKSYALYIVIAISIIALILIVFDKPTNSRNKKHSGNKLQNKKKKYLNNYKKNRKNKFFL